MRNMTDMRPEPLLECPVCLSVNLGAVMLLGSYHLSRCRDCSHLFVADRIPPEALKDAYDHAYYVRCE